MRRMLLLLAGQTWMAVADSSPCPFLLILRRLMQFHFLWPCPCARNSPFRIYDSCLLSCCLYKLRHLSTSRKWEGEVLLWSSFCRFSTRSPNSIISRALRTSDAEILLCCLDIATSWALRRYIRRHCIKPAVTQTSPLIQKSAIQWSMNIRRIHVPR